MSIAIVTKLYSLPSHYEEIVEELWQRHDAQTGSGCPSTAGPSVSYYRQCSTRSRRKWLLHVTSATTYKPVWFETQGRLLQLCHSELVRPCHDPRQPPARRPLEGDCSSQQARQARSSPDLVGCPVPMVNYDKAGFWLRYGCDVFGLPSPGLTGAIAAYFHGAIPTIMPGRLVQALIMFGLGVRTLK